MGALDELLKTSTATTGGALDRLLAQPLQPPTIRQQAGSVPTKAGLKSLLPTKEQLPELGMTTLAGLKFATRRTPVGIAATGLAGMLGESGRQIGERFGVFETPAPETSKEALERILLAGARGAGGEVAGRGITRLFAPFKGSVTPAIKAGTEAAERIGVEPPLSAVSESPMVQSLERMTEYAPIVGKVVTARKQAAVKQLESFTEKIAEGINPDNPPEIVGELVAKKVKDFEMTFRKAKDTLYEPINRILSDKLVEAKNTIAMIKEILRRKEGGKEGRALLEDWLERLEPKGMKAAGYVEPELPTFSRLKSIRTEAGARGGFGDPGITGMKAQIDSIYGAASKDMEDVASQYGMKDALDAVNAQYAKGIKKLQDSLVKAINKRAEKSPETLHKLIFRQNSPTLIKTGREILGEDSFAQIRRQWFDDLIQKSKSIVDGEEIVSPSKLANNLRRMGSSMDEITQGDVKLAQQLADLSDVSKLLTRGPRVALGSQTAFIGLLKSVRGLLTAPLVATETGREFLTTGFPRLGLTVGRIGQVGTQLGSQKISE